MERKGSSEREKAKIKRGMGGFGGMGNRRAKRTMKEKGEEIMIKGIQKERTRKSKLGQKSAT
jgi:hypothetical protein